jgi:DNA repair protein RadC
MRSCEPHSELFEGLRWQDAECFAVAYFDNKQGMLATAHHSDGLRDATSTPIRAIFAEGLALDAATLMIAHNHPGGIALPSAADAAVTRKICQIGAALGIRLVDHLIYAGTAQFSFREAGLL